MHDHLNTACQKKKKRCRRRSAGGAKSAGSLEKPTLSRDLEPTVPLTFTSRMMAHSRGESIREAGERQPNTLRRRRERLADSQGSVTPRPQMPSDPPQRRRSDSALRLLETSWRRWRDAPRHQPSYQEHGGHCRSSCLLDHVQHHTLKTGLRHRCFLHKHNHIGDPYPCARLPVSFQSREVCDYVGRGEHKVEIILGTHESLLRAV